MKRKHHFSAPTMVELKDKIYKANGWKRKAGESMSKRIKAKYRVCVDFETQRIIAREKSGDNP